MTTSEMLRLATAMTDLARAFKEDWTDEAFKLLYYRVLLDLPLEAALEACCQWLVSDHAFFPRPGQLRTLALAHRAAPLTPGTMQARAEMAWQNLRVLATARYNRWALEDAVTRQVFVAMGGGYTTASGFGQWDAKYEEARHRDFVARYLDLASQHGTLAALPEAPPRALEVSPRALAPGPEDEDHRDEIRALITQAQDRMSVPPMPLTPRHETTRQVAREYTPSLSPQALAERKAFLVWQGQQLAGGGSSGGGHDDA